MSAASSYSFPPVFDEKLNAEQKEAFNAVKSGENLFLTGAGGTGKSHTIRAVTDWATYNHIPYAVTALTGCAALLLNCKAKTLHSWGGIGLAKETAEILIEVIKKNRRAARRWTDTQLLIIDEVSMMSPELFEKLDKIGRALRKRPEQPFGGLQLVLTGDFCQLPPVIKGDIVGPRFIFEMPLWKSVIHKTIYLQKIVRQSDPVFQRVLNEARLGVLSPESIHELEMRLGLPWQENEIRPTLLFTRNAEVDEVNRRNMEALTTERRTYEVQTVVMDSNIIIRKGLGGREGIIRKLVVPPTDPDVLIALERLDADSPYEVKLELAIGCQVMLIVNIDIDAGLVNGSRGVVVGFTEEGFPKVKFLSVREPVTIDRSHWWLDDFERIGRSQIPLRVAYAVTIHKSQGSTLDCALVDVGSSTFEYGQAYVALSRLRSLEGLYIWKLDPRKVRCHPAVFEYYSALASRITVTTCDKDMPEDSDPTERDYFMDTALKNVPESWKEIILPVISKRLRERVGERVLGAPIIPSPEEVFSALQYCPNPANIRVILIGQDPYPNAGHAHGLAFSVKHTVTKFPPSLVNIFKELATDLEVTSPTIGNLECWAKQGVLLLNDVLTVIEGARLSHAGIGWETVTSRIILEVLRSAPHVVILAWGQNAQKKLEQPELYNAIRDYRHTVLKAAHPSPLSAYHGFFGSCPFSKTNESLVSHGLLPIKWIKDDDEDDEVTA